MAAWKRKHTVHRTMKSTNNHGQQTHTDTAQTRHRQGPEPGCSEKGCECCIINAGLGLVGAGRGAGNTRSRLLLGKGLVRRSRFSQASTSVSDAPCGWPWLLEASRWRLTSVLCLLGLRGVCSDEVLHLGLFVTWSPGFLIETALAPAT